MSLTGDGPQRCHPACVVTRRRFCHLSPFSRLTIFYRDASSSLFHLVNQSRSHAFCYGIFEESNSRLAHYQYTFILGNICCIVGVRGCQETTRATRVHVQYRLQLQHLFVWCPCMAIPVSVRHNGGFLPDISLLTRWYSTIGEPVYMP